MRQTKERAAVALGRLFQQSNELPGLGTVVLVPRERICQGVDNDEVGTEIFNLQRDSFEQRRCLDDTIALKLTQHRVLADEVDKSQVGGEVDLVVHPYTVDPPMQFLTFVLG